MTEPTWTFIPPTLEWTPETLPPADTLVWIVDENDTGDGLAKIGLWSKWWMSWSGSDDVCVYAWAPIDVPALPAQPECGAVYDGRPGQAPCRKRPDHHLGPDSDWKRDMHSNGLLKWPVNHEGETR